MASLINTRRVMIAVSSLVAASGAGAFIAATQVQEGAARGGGDTNDAAAMRDVESGSGLIKLLSLCGTAGGLVLLVAALRANAQVAAMQKDIDEVFNLLNATPQETGRTQGVDLARLRAAASNVRLDIIDAHKKEKAVVDRAADVVCILDLESRFTFVSPAARRAWGYEPAELIGRSLTTLMIGEQSDQKLQSIIGAENSIQEVVFECQLQKKNGTVADVEWNGHWSASDAGFFCIVHDITEKKRLERLQREFLAMVAHDLRSPISGMQGVLALMEAGILGRLTPEGQQITGKVRQNCKRLVRLLNDMLELDKADAGKFGLERCNFPLQAAIEQAIVDVRVPAQERRVAIVTSQEPVVCFGDEDRLTQVIVNLLSNAIKYAPEGSQVSITAAPDASGNARVCVSDSGRGIPPEKVTLIFEKFEQVMASDAADRRGVGLGLAICKSIVEEHGGAIGVDSKPGEGSTFWFTVPQAESAQALETASRSGS